MLTDIKIMKEFVAPFFSDIEENLTINHLFTSLKHFLKVFFDLSKLSVLIKYRHQEVYT